MDRIAAGTSDPYFACFWQNETQRFFPSRPESAGQTQDSLSNGPAPDEGRLDLDAAALVEVTSEDKEYPVESALVSRETQGWRAAASDAQTILVSFDQPQSLRRISLVFEEATTERTQEFVLRWSADKGRSFREIVRQQWNFSPPNSISEVE
jgi:hypothetical protein